MGRGPFEGILFDFVITISVFQYIPIFRIDRFLRSIYRVKTPGGVFFLTFPQSDSRGFLKLVRNFNYTRYRPTLVCSALRDSGFELVKQGT